MAMHIKNKFLIYFLTIKELNSMPFILTGLFRLDRSESDFFRDIVR